MAIDGDPLPPVPEIKRIGVIGAGQMGWGITYVAAAAGFDVVATDIDQDRLDQALGRIEAYADRQVGKRALEGGEKDALLGRITTGTDVALHAECDLVIEAATENEQLKRQIFQAVLPHLRDDAIIASNTSSISITRLASSTDRPERFIGMHFMNPVPVMKLVELIRGIATAEDTYQAVVAVTDRMHKLSVTAEDFPAFIVNRILLPMINEAVYTLYEGVGTVESIDTAMRLGANHPMGPLELADFIGLDTCLSVMHVLHEGLADTKYRPCPLLVKYVEAGWLGRKTKRGFYDYRGEKPVPTR